MFLLLLDKRLLLHDKIMSGKVLIQWRHNYCAAVAKRRYMDVERTRSLHMELANLFFPPLLPRGMQSVCPQKVAHGETLG